MTYQRLAIEVLADRVEVEQTLRLVSSSTRECELLRTEAENLRREYDRLIVGAMQFGRPVPPAFPAR